jgi:biopolymer transport protein ExbD
MPTKTVYRVTVDETGAITIEKETVETQSVSDAIEDLIDDIAATKKTAQENL